MEYTSINDYNKVTALEDRMTQLEQAHYSSSVYLLESEAVGDQASIEKFKTEMHGIDLQYNAIKVERDQLIEKLERENPIEDEDNNAGELRGDSSS